MLMTPNEESSQEHKRNRQKRESVEEEEEAARLLTEDPLDWVMKNEHISTMLSVRFLKVVKARIKLFCFRSC